jgi:plasmid stability protein
MANLTIRNLDAQIVENLKLRAKANHRSLEGEIRLLLERFGRQPSKEELARQAEEIAALTLSRLQPRSAPLRSDAQDR